MSPFLNSLPVLGFSHIGSDRSLELIGFLAFALTAEAQKLLFGSDKLELRSLVSIGFSYIATDTRNLRSLMSIGFFLSLALTAVPGEAWCH